MAAKDKKEWMQVLHKRFGFSSESKLRSDSDYVRDIPFWQLLEIAEETDNNFIIHIIFPFRKPYSSESHEYTYVAVFPQSIYYGKALFVLTKPIFYNDVFYSVSDFISMCPEIGRLSKSMLDEHKLSYSYFMLATEEQNLFKKKVFTKIRKEIVEHGSITETRGKFKNRTAIEERNDFIKEKAKKIKGKYSTYRRIAEEIRDCLFDEAGKRYPEYKESQVQRKQYRIFACEINTIMNVIREIKNLRKK